MQLSQLVGSIEQLWPKSLAEEWDAPGLILGDPAAEISKVLLSVDVTDAVVEEAVELGCELILAHHPYLLRGAKFLPESQAKGALIAKAIRNEVAIYAAHTNADVVEHGVSDVLAKALGILKPKPLVPTGDKVGSGRIGKLSDSMTLGNFARLVANTLPATATGVRVAGDYDQIIETVAVCGGAGDSFIEAAVQANADVYVTADLRHHVVQDARELAALRNSTPALIDVSHWASEWLWLDQAAKQLNAKNSSVQFFVSDLRTDPWDFVVTQ